MSNCYLCGEEKHTYDCPKFVSPISSIENSTPIAEATYPQLSSDGKIAYFKIKDSIWRVARVKYGEKIPMWAKRGWYLNNDDTTISCSSLSLKELAGHWSDSASRPWVLNSKDISSGEKSHRRTDLLVFDIEYP